MKYLFKPLASLSIGIGKIARFIWNGENKVSQTQLIQHPELIPIEKRKNGTVGAIILGVISVAVAIIAILFGPSRTDVKHLEVKMQDSFSRMEMLDLLTNSDGSISADSAIAYYQHRRGKLKMIATLLRQQIVFHEELNFSSTSGDLVSVAESAKDIMQTYMDIHAYIMEDMKEMARYEVSHRDSTTAFIDIAYFIQWDKRLDECNNLLNDQNREIIRIFQKMGDMKAANRPDKTKLSRLCKQAVNNKEAVAYKIELYKLIDLLYEYSITKEMYLRYGKTQVVNSNQNI